MTSGNTAAESVQVGDLRIAYRRTGEGPALLLLHGAVCDSRVWRLVANAFSDGHTVVAVSGDDAILRQARRDQPGAHRLLPDVQVQEPADLALLVKLGSCLFDAADQHHLVIQIK